MFTSQMFYAVYQFDYEREEFVIASILSDEDDAKEHALTVPYCRQPDRMTTTTAAPVVPVSLDRIFDELCADRLRNLGADVLHALKSVGKEVGWLIERQRNTGVEGVSLVEYRSMAQGMYTWVEDPCKAIRFANRDSAEMFAEEDEDAIRIVEHMFILEKAL